MKNFCYYFLLITSIILSSCSHLTRKPSSVDSQNSYKEVYENIRKTYNFPLVEPIGGATIRFYANAYDIEMLLCLKKDGDKCTRKAYLSLTNYTEKPDRIYREYRIYEILGDSSDIIKMATEYKRENEVKNVEHKNYFYRMTGSTLLSALQDNPAWLLASIPAFVVDTVVIAPYKIYEKNADLKVAEKTNLSNQEQIIFDFILDPSKANQLLKLSNDAIYYSNYLKTDSPFNFFEIDGKLSLSPEPL